MGDIGKSRMVDAKLGGCMRKEILFFILMICAVYGCTVKAIGDPKRPITIEAHITVDVKGLKNTANDIEDFVSGAKPKPNLPIK